MKYLLFTLLVIGLGSCEKASVDTEISDSIAFVEAEAYSEFDCINQQADNPTSEDNARKWIVGKWQLKGMITMMPTTEVPNIKIEFKEDGGVFVTNAGKNIFTNAYSINETTENGFKYLIISTDFITNTDNFGNDLGEYNFLKGTIRICENELMIDNGIAFDAPGYLLRKIK